MLRKCRVGGPRQHFASNFQPEPPAEDEPLSRDEPAYRCLKPPLCAWVNLNCVNFGLFKLGTAPACVLGQVVSEDCDIQGQPGIADRHLNRHGLF